MSKDKDTTLGTVARQGTTYRRVFRCPLPRPFPQARMDRTIWAAIITMDSRCIRRSSTTNPRCHPVSSQARHRDPKGYRDMQQTTTRTATMAKANRTHRPILDPLFLALINSLQDGPNCMDRGDLIHLMLKTHLRVTVFLVVL